MSHTARHAADETALRAALHGLPVAAYTTDAEGFINYYNVAAERFAGRTPIIGRDRWCVSWRLFRGDGRLLAHEDCPMAVALRENRCIRGVTAIAERPDGTRIRFMPYPTPFNGVAGEVTGGINMLMAVADEPPALKLRDAQASDNRKMHSACLQLIDLVMREARDLSVEAEAKMLLSTAAHRIQAIILAEGGMPLTATSGVNSWELISTVCATTRSVLTENVDLQCRADSIELSVDVALPLSFLARELIVNAAKHGLNGRSHVQISLEFRKSIDDGLTFTVEDDGPGYTLAGGRQLTFGLSLITSLARILRASFTVERTPGAKCILRFSGNRTLH